MKKNVEVAPLRSGTILQSSNLSFLTLYKTMFLLTATKKRFSSKELQRQLDLKRYEPVLSMVHKLRKAMGNRDDRCILGGMIEMDEGYFTIEHRNKCIKPKQQDMVIRPNLMSWSWLKARFLKI